MSLDLIRVESVRMRGFLRAAETQASKVIGIIDSMLSPTGMWMKQEEILALPMGGPAWDAIVARATGPYVSPDLSDQNSQANTDTLARALVYVRMGDDGMRYLVEDALQEIVGSGTYAGSALALGRELAAYVIAADLIDVQSRTPSLDIGFRAKLRELRDTPTTGAAPNLIASHEHRPNNWGTMAGASRIAVAIYLKDTVDLEKAANVFRGYLGEQAAYKFAATDFGGPFGQEDHSWEHDETAPVGINPRGSTKAGLSIDGVLPDDQRRGGPFSGGITQENYVWEALQGAVVQAALLQRVGYSAWTWGDQALLRALTWLHDVAAFPAVGDDCWVPWLANHALSTKFPVETPTKPGKIIGFTDWTHA